MSEHTMCVIDGREAEYGYLCAGHYTRLSSMLRDIEDQAAMLEAVPSMAIRSGSGGGSLKSERAPARLDVLAFADPQTRKWVPDPEPRYTPPEPKAIGPWCLLCDHDSCTAWRAGRQRDLHDDELEAGSADLLSILGILHGWARVVREERDLAAPQRVTVTTERDLLSRHLEWIAEQPFVDETYNELRDLVDGLKALNRTQDERPAGTCFLLNDGGVCGGKIWRRDTHRAVWRVGEDRCSREIVETADGPAYCERCASEWDGADLDRLNLILEQQRAELARPKTSDGRRMLTAQEMADQLGCSLNAVRIIVSRKSITNVRGHYDPDAFADKAAA